MTREELIRDEDYTEEQAEIILLKDKIETLQQKIENYEDTIRFVKEKIELFIGIDKRCLADEPNKIIKNFLQLEIKHNEELLELLNYDG